MKILETKVYNDENGEVVGITLPIEIEKGDEVTPATTHTALVEWLYSVSEETRESLIRNGIGGSVVEKNVQDKNYSIKFSIQRPYYPCQGLPLGEVLYRIAYNVWREANWAHEKKIRMPTWTDSHGRKWEVKIDGNKKD